MTTDRTTKSSVKPKISVLEGQRGTDLNKVLRGMLHRRALEFHQRLRQVRAKLQNNRQRLVFDYIYHNTIGFNKLSDPIALSQFEQGKRNSETGEVIDTGCGLSHNPIRKARKELIQLGVIVEESVADSSGASQANRYTIRFVIEMVEAEIAYKKTKHLKRDTVRGYQSQVDTIKLPTEVIKQRCIKSKKQKNKSVRNHHMHRDHVDYLVDEMEKVTGDKHSRGGFAQVAMTTPEARLMKLLHQLRDRQNIKNKGAWLIAVASQYNKRRVIVADTIKPHKFNSNQFLEWDKNRKRLSQNLSMQTVFQKQKPVPIYEQKHKLIQMQL